MEFEDVSEEVDWEMGRVARAFEVEAWQAMGCIPFSPSFAGRYYTGSILQPGTALSCILDDATNQVIQFDLHSLENRIVDVRVHFSSRSGGWSLSGKPNRELREVMAHGLYRLGFEDELVLNQLPHLSAHEKLELRFSMPREFWPPKWRDEETP